MSGEAPLRVGDVLTGGAGGWFGRDTYDDVRVEAIGADWVVVREFSGMVHSACFYGDERPELLTRYRA